MAAELPPHGSLNLLFSGKVEGDDPDLPPGESVTQKIEGALRERSWVIVEPADLGDYNLWSIVCKQGSAELKIRVAGTSGQDDTSGQDEWMLQIGASYEPGLVGRARRRPPSATSFDIHRLAQELHEILFVDGEFRDPKWCWDGFPDEMQTFPEPPGPDVPAVLVRRQRVDWSRLRPRNARERQDCFACLGLLAIWGIGLALLVPVIVRWVWHLFR